jgi:hypothetical protein
MVGIRVYRLQATAVFSNVPFSTGMPFRLNGASETRSSDQIRREFGSPRLPR